MYTDGNNRYHQYSSTILLFILLYFRFFLCRESLHVPEDAVKVAVILLQSLHNAVIFLINFPDVVCNGHEEFVVLIIDLIIIIPGSFCILDNLKVLACNKLLLLIFRGNSCFF